MSRVALMRFSAATLHLTEASHGNMALWFQMLAYLGSSQYVLLRYDTFIGWATFLFVIASKANIALMKDWEPRIKLGFSKQFYQLLLGALG
uniref:Putative secreted protein n=1 Tax=Anopheles marajoara TaxID=58244 RepID=A0A2M4C9U7_9DIPT